MAVVLHVLYRTQSSGTPLFPSNLNIHIDIINIDIAELTSGCCVAGFCMCRTGLHVSRFAAWCSRWAPYSWESSASGCSSSRWSSPLTMETKRRFLSDPIAISSGFSRASEVFAAQETLEAHRAMKASVKVSAEGGAEGVSAEAESRPASPGVATELEGAE